jgi:IS30 family transposase
MRAIAQGLSRACSTVSREVARHGGRAQYRANEADQQAWESALRPKLCRLAMQEQLRKIVASKLILDWSPKQISGWLKQRIPTTRACACLTKRSIWLIPGCRYEAQTAEFERFGSRMFGSAIRPAPKLIDAMRDTPLDEGGLAGV